MANSVIDIRNKARQDLELWFTEKVADPFVMRCTSHGLTETETNILFSALVLERFRGLLGLS